MTEDARVILVDDEEDLLRAGAQTLDLADIPAIALNTAEAALAEIDRHVPAILVTDIRMPGLDGLQLMKRVLEIDPAFPVILVTGHGDVDLAVQSMRDGAYDFIEKPYAPSRLVATCQRALEKRRLTLENRALRREVGARDRVEARLVGRSEPIIALRRALRTVAQTEADVLIIGDTGTGKEVAARALHRESARSAKPFVAVNCAALPEALVESELFGHEAGAFPGAARARVGRFEHARGGTLFLDEIDSLSPPVQAKLLSAIQDRAVTRLGSNDPVPLDIRFVAASKRDLVSLSEDGTFRADLAYRLNVVTLRMPTLDERRTDIPQLFAHLANESAARYNRPPQDVPGALLAALAARDWPGNVRELRNAAERFALGLPLELASDLNLSEEQTLSERVATHEKALIAAAIEANRGSMKATYEALGLSRKALYEKMRKYGLGRGEDA